MAHSGGTGYTLRMRGLPFKVSEIEIENWLRDRGVNVAGVVIQYGGDGRPSGQAFVDVESEDDIHNGLSLSGQHMGQRYIEVFRSDENSAADAAQSPANAPRMTQAKSGYSHSGPAGPYDDCIVRLRGLPFAATEQDVANFLHGTNIAPQGIHLVFNHENRPSGEAYVELVSAPDVNACLSRDRRQLGHRYIEIFKSSYAEMNGGPAPKAITYGGGKGGGGKGGFKGGGGGGGYG
eukprot:gene4464-6919_t